MAKIYLVRHQAAGLVHEFPFSQPPSEPQVDAVKAFCLQSHGFGHPKTPDEPYWVRVEERDLLGSLDLPVAPERTSGLSVNSAAAGEFSVSGSGTVTNPQV